MKTLVVVDKWFASIQTAIEREMERITQHLAGRVKEAREAIKALCEPVEPPRDTQAYLRYFCAAKSGDIGQLKDNEPKRVALYMMATGFLRSYANLANEMREAGYSVAEASEIKTEVDHYEKVRTEAKLASSDYIDMKMYEPAMRHLLDSTSGLRRVRSFQGSTT